MNAPPPPGWYPDQADPRYVRWWDGGQWTSHVQPAQPQQPPPAPNPQQHGPQQQGTGQQPGQPQPGPRPQPFPQQAAGQQAAGQQAAGQQAPGQQPPRPAPPQPGQGDGSPIELALGGTGDAESVQKQVQDRAGVGGTVGGGGATLFTEPVLVVNQKAKLVEMANEYAVYDQHGRQLGSVVQTGQSGAQKALRLLTKLDSLMTVHLQIRDAHGTPVLTLTRPATLWKSTVHVHRPDGAPVGDIRLENAFGRARFAFEVGGHRVGGLNAENLRAWDIKVLDEQDQPVGQISKTWQGLGKAMFTTADNYVLQIHRPLQDPLRSLVVASALTVDTTLGQTQK